MSAEEGLVRWLRGRPVSDGATVVGWRLEVAEMQGLRLGLRSSQIGGPYEGPGLAERVGGVLALHWSDGKLTRAGLDREAIIFPEEALAGWRESAMTERGGRLPPLAGPTVLPEVQIYDPAIAAAVLEDAESLLGLLGRLRGDVLARGPARVDATVRASRGARQVLSSEGLHAAWDETACSVELWADEVGGAAFGRRCQPTDEDLERVVSEAASLALAFRRDEPLPEDARGVLLMPPLVESLLGRLLLPNLAGRAIRDGRSPFSRADLESGRVVMREDLDLTLDTTLPFELGTAPCSSEGVPAGRASLVQRGRLVGATLDLATAQPLGRAPTPVPRGRPAALLTTSGVLLSLDVALGLLGAGAIVRELPGLHTQQPRRGAYALVAPDAQVVQREVPGGRCAVRVAGNLLDHLSRPSTRLVRISGEVNPGLLILDGVHLIPA